MSHLGTDRNQAIQDPGKYVLVPQQEMENQQELLGGAPVDRQSTFGSEGRAARAAQAVQVSSCEACRACIGRWLVQSDLFQSLVALVIMTNCVIMGLETDYPEQGDLWSRMERTCLCIFVFEIAMRFVYLGCDFFSGSDLGWNIFDLVIVLAGICDTALEVMETAEETQARHRGRHKRGGFGDISIILRGFRLLRILRVFRLFRMLTGLYTLVMGFVESLQSVMWVSILASLCLFICAVFLTRSLGRPLGLNVLEDTDPDDSGRDEALFYQESFGTVPRSMFTLFTLMATPDLLRMQVALDESLGVTFFFIGFVVFGSFAMISILTGVISESMVAKGQMRRENMRFEEEEKLKAMRAKLKSHFKDFDLSDDGLLSREEFADAIPSLLSLLQENEEDAFYSESDLIMVYDLMDMDSGGNIDTDAFLQGMEQFDCRLHQVPLQMMKFQATMSKRHNNLEREIKAVKASVEDIRKMLVNQFGLPG